MRVIVESPDVEARELRALTVRRVRIALRRLAWLVPGARVRLTDVNGARGGIDKRCQVELTTDGIGPVVVTSISRSWHVALQSALSRAAGSLLRHWSRERNHRIRTPLAVTLDR